MCIAGNKKKNTKNLCYMLFVSCFMVVIANVTMRSKKFYKMICPPVICFLPIW